MAEAGVPTTAVVRKHWMLLAGRIPRLALSPGHENVPRTATLTVVGVTAVSIE